MVSQEAAASLVASRLRTPQHDPMQLFGLLDRCLHHALRGAFDVSAHEMKSRLCNSWALLEFFFGLEKGLFNAYEGSIEREPPSDSIVTYFTGNKRVSQPRLSTDINLSPIVQIQMLALGRE